MSKDTIQVSIEAADGRPLRYYSHEGKTFVESHEDRAYQIRVKNRTDERVKIVPVVDSLNVITGQPGTDDPKETGYVLAPYEEYIIKGFRVDGDQVAQFKFVKREKSYATERGEGQGNGVIAIRAYSDKSTADNKRIKDIAEKIREFEKRSCEKEYVPYPVYPARPWYWEDYWYGPYRRPAIWCGGYVNTSTTEAANIQSGDNLTSTEFTCSNAVGPVSTVNNVKVLGATNSRADLSRCAGEITSCVVQSDVNPFDAGTAWGGAVKDSVKEVAFEVGKLLDEVVVYYAFVEGLKALGIDVTRAKAVTFPEPFKKTYCPRPSGWAS